MNEKEFKKLLDCADFVCLNCTELCEETCEICPVRKTLDKLDPENKNGTN